jgi:hypothetical protein
MWWIVWDPFRRGLTAFVIGVVPTVAVLVRLFRGVERP